MIDSLDSLEITFSSDRYLNGEVNERDQSIRGSELGEVRSSTVDDATHEIASTKEDTATEAVHLSVLLVAALCSAHDERLHHFQASAE